MDKGANTNKYQIVWNLLEYDSAVPERFNALIKYIGQNCVRIIVVGHRTDFEQLESVRKLDTFIQHIEVGENERRSAIWQIIRREPMDSIILDSDIYVTDGWINKLINYAYSDVSISCAVPIEVRVENVSDVRELSRLTFTKNEKIDNITEGRSHCLFLKGEIIYKFRKCQNEIFSTLPEKIGVLGGKLVKCNDVLLGSLSAQHGDRNIIRRVQLLKRMKVNNGKKNILYFLLADFREDASNNMGGTQLHVKDLALGLKNKYNVIVMARDQEYLRVTEYCDEERISFKFYIGPIPQNTVFYDKRCAEVYRMVLEAFCIDIVHVHHTLWMTLDIFMEAERLGIPVIFTMHDYYTICPVLTMVNMNGDVCTERRMTEECIECLKSKKGVSEEIDYIALWRERELFALEKCNCIIVPSNSVKKTIEKYYPSLYDKTIVINHGIELPDSGREGFTEIDKNKPLRVAFIGDLGKQKGSELIYDIIVNSNLTEYEWYLIGGVGDEKLFHLKKKNLVKHGWYRKEELSYLLEKYRIDIVCILSLVPETYSYTFSEAMANKIPLIVTDIGALGERIKEYGVGWSVSCAVKSQEVLALLNRIRERPEEYQERKMQLESVHNISIQDMLDKYIDVYEGYPKKEIVYRFNSRMFFKGCIDGENEENETGFNSEEDLICDLQQEIEIIKNSGSYRMAKAWENFKMPGKSYIEKAIITILDRKENFGK